jgi:hypothetical protein
LFRSSKAAVMFFWTLSELGMGKKLLATNVLELGTTTEKTSQNESARSRLTLELRAMTDAKRPNAANVPASSAARARKPATSPAKAAVNPPGRR